MKMRDKVDLMPSESITFITQEVFLRLSRKGFALVMEKPVLKLEGSMLTASVRHYWTKYGEPISDADMRAELAAVADELVAAGVVARVIL